MKKLEKSKLRLDKEIITTLSNNELQQVQGGYSTVITLDDCDSKTTNTVNNFKTYFNCMETDMCLFPPVDQSQGCSGSCGCGPYTAAHQCTGVGCAFISNACEPTVKCNPVQPKP